jgi:hypothetical protein
MADQTINDNRINFEGIPVLIGLFSALSLVLSVIYDWGYFIALDISFADAPTSLSDHVKSALVWMPPVALIIFIVIVIELLTQRIERGTTQEELFPPSKTSKLTYFLYWSPAYAIIAFSIYTIVLKIMQHPIPVDRMVLSIGFLWVWLSGKFFTPPRLQQKYPPLFRKAFRWVPVIVLFVWYLGFSAAQDAITTSKSSQSLMLKGNDNQKISVIPLRSFEKALLVWHPEVRKCEFVPWQSIHRVMKKRCRSS